MAAMDIADFAHCHGFSYFACSPKAFVIFSYLPGDLALKNAMAGIVGEFSMFSVSEETKHEKVLRHFGEIRENIWEKLREKIKKIVLRLFWPEIFPRKSPQTFRGNLGEHLGETSGEKKNRSTTFLA